MSQNHAPTRAPEPAPALPRASALQAWTDSRTVDRAHDAAPDPVLPHLAERVRCSSGASRAERHARMTWCAAVGAGLTSQLAAEPA